MPDPSLDAHASLLAQHRPQYQALRHHSGDSISSRRKGQQQEEAPVLFEGANGLAVPLHLGGVAGKEEEEEEEAARRRVDVVEGEEETARMRAMEEKEVEGEGKETPVVERMEHREEEGEQGGRRRGQEGEGMGEEEQEERKRPAWWWPEEKEAAREAYGVRRFGLRPTAWTTGGSGTCGGRYVGLWDGGV